MLNLAETKQFLRVDYDDDDILINSLMKAAEQYLLNATGKTFDKTNQLAFLYCNILVNEWYNNRELMQDDKVSNKVKFTLGSILTQLQLEEPDVQT